MPNEHFCLKWNNFQRNIVAALGNLKLDEDFVDVTISCEGKYIKAHKVILSACSDYFRDLFRENPCQHPVIILRDASYTDVEGLVRYVYRGEVDVLPQHLQSFLKTADTLKIKGLADQAGLGQDLTENVKEDPEVKNDDEEEEEDEEDDDDEDDEEEDDDEELPPASAARSSNNNSFEPLKVPIPPNSNHNFYKNTQLSSDEGRNVAKKRKLSGSPSPTLSSNLTSLGPLNLSSSSSPKILAPVPILAPSSGFNFSPAAEMAVPSLLKESPASNSGNPASYPDHATTTNSSFLMLQNSTKPNSPPKHIKNFETADEPNVEEPIFDELPATRAGNAGKKAKNGRKKSLSKNGGMKKDVEVMSAHSEGENNNENSANHPRNRWRCMQPRLCNYCWKTFSNSFNLKQHIVNVHIQSQGVTCSLCEKVVKNKWYLRKHLVTAHGAPLKRVNPKMAGAKDPADNSGNNSENDQEKINPRLSATIC